MKTIKIEDKITEMVKAVIRSSIEKGSTDNLSGIVISINWFNFYNFFFFNFFNF